MTNYINSRSRRGVPLRPVEEIPIVAPEQDAGLTAASKAVRRFPQGSPLSITFTAL